MAEATLEPGEPPTVDPQLGLNAVTSKVEGSSNCEKKQMRSFAQILAEERENRNILEIKLTRSGEKESFSKSENISLEKIGELMFDIIKIKPEECLAVALVTNRFDIKEIKLKPGVDPAQYITTKPIIFENYEVTVRRQSNKVVQVMFKGVPLCIPDEEIINLCECYGEPIINEVIYKPNVITRGLPSTTK